MQGAGDRVPLAYELLKQAGSKQLVNFLSGEGGMGKSMLIRLLTQWWRRVRASA